MADATGRAIALVNTARTTTPTQAQFAREVLAVMQEHGDIAAEATWQQFARLIAQDWTMLCADQPPIATWQMLSRCSDVVLRLRKQQQRQGQDSGGEEALEAFRKFMGEVLGQNTAE